MLLEDMLMYSSHYEIAVMNTSVSGISNISQNERVYLSYA